MRQVCRWLSCALEMCLFAMSLLALAQQTATAAASTPPFHLVAPVDKFPQPDYFLHALKHTKFQPEGRFKTLKLTSSLQPDLLVLPVQSQAFGWTPAFAALVAAQLDHELSVRGVNANRQTDLFDVDGPYVRRFDEADIQSFAGLYPKASVLALYIGRDAVGKVFITMTLKRGEQQSVVHRTLPDQAAAPAVLASMVATFPPMLSELKLGRTSPEVSARRQTCDMQDWRLPDPSPADDAAQRACRALILGTLLPELDRASWQYPSLLTPAKLAWLAQAYAEAPALAVHISSAIQSLAWAQLGLDPTKGPVPSAVDDPVVQPLTRLVFARSAISTSPVKSPDDAVQAAAAEAARELPPFAAAVFMERARYDEDFRRVDLCAIELKLPWMRLPNECTGMEEMKESRRQVAATYGERALVEEWRVAKGYKALLIEGVFRGAPAARQAVIDRMPARVAAQPFIRQLKFSTERFDEATGSFDELVARASAAVHDAVQSLVDSQRSGSARMMKFSVSAGQWTANKVLSEQRTIRDDGSAERRLVNVLNLDGFSLHFPNCCRLPASSGLEFLLDSYAGTPIAVTSRGIRILSNDSPSPEPQGAMIQPLLPHFERPRESRSGSSLTEEEEALADMPENMALRVEVALERMKSGQTVEAARKLIDQRADDRRTGYAISESNSWAFPAHAFFFAGELPAARIYYAKVARIGTSSDSDLHARVRIPMIDGDVKTAMERTEERLDRYENDFARRDLAGLRFLLGQSERAWAALTPRLSQSGQLELWMGAEVGHRMRGASMREVKEWISRSGYGNARVSGLNVGSVFLGRYITDDRVPSEEELALLDAEVSGAAASGNVLRAHARLQRLAFEQHVDEAAIREVRDLIATSWPRSSRSILKPLYAWSAWRASGGKDPALDGMTEATLESDLDALLSKGMILGLKGDVSASATYLRAARIELSQLAIGQLNSDLRSAEYAVALCAYLLYSHTGDPRYREEALTMAHAYQRIFPFLAWPYALDALLSPPGASRSLAACRARYLDPRSRFLSLVSLPKQACRKNLW